MNLENFIKKLSFPASFKAPTQFTYENLVAKPLTRSDLQADMHAVNSSIEIIRKTRGGPWPEEAVTEEFDLLDLAWHEREFRDGTSFAYAVYDDKNNYIGCFYLYPMGERTTLSEELMQYDIDASWWVTTKAYSEGLYPKLHKALQQLVAEFPVSNIYYSNKEIPS